MKTLTATTATLLVLVLTGMAAASTVTIEQLVYSENFEAGFSDGADVSGNANWGGIPVGHGVMNAGNSIGYTGGWGMTAGQAVGGRQRYLPSGDLTSGKYELRALVEMSSYATIQFYHSPNDRIWFGINENLDTFNIEGYKGSAYTELGNTALPTPLSEGDWIEMSLIWDIESGVVDAAYRDVSEDGSGTPPAFTALGTAGHNMAGYIIGGTWFASPDNGANWDNIQLLKLTEITIPEPATLSLLALGGAATLTRRRR